MIRGIGASEGIAIGKAYVKQEIELKIRYRQIDHPEDELERFNAAAEKCRIDLERRYNKTTNILGEDEAEVYKRHLGVYDGSILLGQVRKEIQEQKTNAEHILNEVKKKYASMFDKVADDFLKKKSESIKYIAEQIIRELVGIDTTGLADIDEPVIIVASEIDTNDVVHLNKNSILGFITEIGSKSSYSAVIANNFEVPCVVGAKGAVNQINTGDEIILDGQKGEIIISPDEETKQSYARKVNREKELVDVYQNYKFKTTETIDGHHFDLSVMADNVSEVSDARESGTEGIGVLSTEFMFLGREQAPTEQSQLEGYREAITRAEGLPVVFRTLDCTQDNNIPYLYFHQDRNPLIGYRSIRVTLKERELFLDQLKAILRASAYGPTKILLPMITTVHELLDAKLVIEEAKVALQEQGVLYDSDIPIGMILEVPSAAMMTDLFAKEVDFFMIGSTDFMQFMNAVDRTNEQLHDLYDSFNPGLLRLLKQVVTAAHKEGTWIGICGDMTMNELLLPFFIAIGLDQVSTDSVNIAKYRWIASKIDKTNWHEYVKELLDLSSGNDVKLYLEDKYFNEVIMTD